MAGFVKTAEPAKDKSGCICQQMSCISLRSHNEPDNCARCSGTVIGALVSSFGDFSFNLGCGGELQVTHFSASYAETPANIKIVCFAGLWTSAIRLVSVLASQPAKAFIQSSNKCVVKALCVGIVWYCGSWSWLRSNLRICLKPLLQGR